jgi:transposase-like protein
MRYSYEFKRKCVELYGQGKWPDTPDGVKERSFHVAVRQWAKIEASQGPEALRHKNQNKVWKPEEKLELVLKVLSGHSNKSVALNAGISDGMLYLWVRKYKTLGYTGLVDTKKGRPPKESKVNQMKAKKTTPLTESEREELMRLRAEIQYIKAENEVIKKEIALREERQAALLKAKKQQSLKNSGKKDIS